MNAQLGQYRTLLARHVKPHGARFVLLAALLLGSIGLQLASPQIVRVFIDQVTSGRESQALLGAALAHLGVTLLDMVVTVGRRTSARAWRGPQPTPYATNWPATACVSICASTTSAAPES